MVRSTVIQGFNAGYAESMIGMGHALENAGLASLGGMFRSRADKARRHLVIPETKKKKAVKRTGVAATWEEVWNAKENRMEYHNRLTGMTTANKPEALMTKKEKAKLAKKRESVVYGPSANEIAKQALQAKLRAKMRRRR